MLFERSARPLHELWNRQFADHQRGMLTIRRGARGVCLAGSFACWQPITSDVDKHSSPHPTQLLGVKCPVAAMPVSEDGATAAQSSSFPLGHGNLAARASTTPCGASSRDGGLAVGTQWTRFTYCAFW